MTEDNIHTKVINEQYSLPQIPDIVSGVEICSILLTNRNESCWKFLFEEIKDIPNAFADNQDYDFSVINESKWQEVTVPSSLAMQGFNIESNTEYYYKRTVKIPK
ncbi:MAG: hypothetical protein ACI4RF_02355, partial [Eubacterium sp.]